LISASEGVTIVGKEFQERSARLPKPNKCDVKDSLQPCLSLIGAPMAGTASRDGKAAVAASPQLAANALRVASGVASMPIWTDVYTVMMRNLPNKVTQQLLLSAINEAGFSHAYDFLHLPIDPETMANRGYAFLNFVSTEWALKFHSHFEGTQFSTFNSSKIVSVVPATLQGYKANHDYYASARVRLADPASRPLFLRGPAGYEPQVQARPESLIDLAAEQRCEQMLQQQKQEKQVFRTAEEAVPSPAAPPTEAAFSAAEFASACQYIASLTGINANTMLAEVAKLKEATRQPEPQRFPKFCPYCGGKHEPSFKFCRYCGASVEQY
jgi:hypothetical protein